MHTLAERILQHDVRAAARACRLCDDRVHGYLSLLRELFPSTGRAFVIGITGNPGAGKSSLVDKLIEAYRQKNQSVAVIAVDPTSPFSGGAILGDRIRMQRHFEDREVFIRSVATRGALGGLSRSTWDVVNVLDAWGANIILVETVGVGQDELEIAKAAHTTVVVMAPGMGDDVQAIKAGILECADVFAVNKADRDGADSTVRDLEGMIALGGETFVAGVHSVRHIAGSLDIAQQNVVHRNEVWVPPVVKCIATRSEGVSLLVEKIDLHRAWQATPQGQVRWKQRQMEWMRTLFRDTLTESALAALGATLEQIADRVSNHMLDPYTATEMLLEAFRNHLRWGTASPPCGILARACSALTLPTLHFVSLGRYPFATKP